VRGHSSFDIGGIGVVGSYFKKMWNMLYLQKRQLFCLPLWYLQTFPRK